MAIKAMQFNVSRVGSIDKKQKKRGKEGKQGRKREGMGKGIWIGEIHRQRERRKKKSKIDLLGGEREEKELVREGKG